jgi:hypothetical protein
MVGLILAFCIGTYIFQRDQKKIQKAYEARQNHDTDDSTYTTGSEKSDEEVWLISTNKAYIRLERNIYFLS